MSNGAWPWARVLSRARAEVGEAWAVAEAIRRYARRVAALTETDEPWSPTTGFETPVAFVNGAAHNASAWSVLHERLAAAGFERVVALEYELRTDSIEDLAADLGTRLERVVSRAGTDQVHVIGHSLGGFALRVWHDLGGGAPLVRAAVSLGSPQQGYTFGNLPPLIPGLPAPMHDLRIGSDLRLRLARAGVEHDRWTTVAGGNDRLVRPADAALAGAENLVVAHIGHLGLLKSRTVAGHVCFALLAAEEQVAARRRAA